MAEEKAKKEEKKEKPKAVTIASVFRDLATKSSKDRKDLASKIFAKLKEKGVTTNVRGKEITEDKVLSQVSAMLRDIKAERGKEKQTGWWYKYEIVEEDGKELKIVARA